MEALFQSPARGSGSSGDASAAQLQQRPKSARKQQGEYGRVQVWLETADAITTCSWEPLCAAEFDDEIYVHELAMGIAVDHIGVTADAAPNFALVLWDNAGARKCQPIHRNVTVKQLQETLNANESQGWQIRLRYHVIPEDVLEVKQADDKAFAYFVAQTVSDFKHGRLAVDITQHETLAVGCLLMMHYSIGKGRSMRIESLPKDVISLERDVGFDPFFPERLWSDFPDVTELKKSLVNNIKPYAALEDQSDCEDRLVQILSNCDPNFGLHVYPAAAKPGETSSGMIVLSLEEITTYKSDGYTPESTIRCADVRQCHIVNAGDSVAAPVAVMVMVTAGSAGDAPISFTCKDNAVHFVSSCDLYRAVLEHQSTEERPRPGPGVFWNILPVAQPPPPRRLPKLPTPSGSPYGSPKLPPKTYSTTPTASPKLPPKQFGTPSGFPRAPPKPPSSQRRPAPLVPPYSPPATPISPEAADKPPRPSKTIRFDSLIFDDEELGHGTFGVVRKAMLHRNDDTGIECAVKQCKLDEDSGNAASEADLKAEFLEEAKLMSTLAHDNIVKLFGTSEEDGMPLIVMELMPLGELRTYIRTKQATLHVCRALLAKYILQVARAVKYLHSLDIIHRDLAARNILVRDPATVKVADFGLSRICSDGVYDGNSEDVQMPLKWMAPESVIPQRFTKQTDVWGFGVCAWEIFSTGIKPFLHIRNAHYLKEMKKGTRLKQPKGCPTAIYKKLRQCWDYDPKKRPSFNSIITSVKRVLDVYVEQGQATVSDEDWRKLGGKPNEFREDVTKGGGRFSPRTPRKMINKVPAKTLQSPSSLTAPKGSGLQRRVSIKTPTCSPARPGTLGKGKGKAKSNPFAKSAKTARSPAKDGGVKGPDYIKMGLAEELGLIGVDDYVKKKGRRPSAAAEGGSLPGRSTVLAALGDKLADSSSEEDSSDDSDSEDDSASGGSSSDGESSDGWGQEYDEQGGSRSNDFWATVDFTPGVRSETTTWFSPTGDFQWEIQGAQPLPPPTPGDSDNDPLSRRIQLVVDHVLKIKEHHASGREVLPREELELILILGQDYHGVLDEIRILLEKNIGTATAKSDAGYNKRVREATQDLGTLFQLVLESMAEVTSNFGLGEIRQLKEEVESCCRKFAIGCMTLSNVVERGNKSFARFRKRAPARKPAQPRYLQYAMRELPV